MLAGGCRADRGQRGRWCPCGDDGRECGYGCQADVAGLHSSAPDGGRTSESPVHASVNLAIPACRQGRCYHNTLVSDRHQTKKARPPAHQAVQGAVDRGEQLVTLRSARPTPVFLPGAAASLSRPANRCNGNRRRPVRPPGSGLPAPPSPPDGLVTRGLRPMPAALTSHDAGDTPGRPR